MDWTLLLSKILLTGILFIILAVVCVLLVTRIQHTLTIHHKREHVVKLSNQGNFTSIFRLSVISIEQMFSFKFLINGIPLMAVPEVETLETPITDSGAPQSVPSVQSKQQHPASMTGANVNRVVKSGRAMAAKAGQAASLLSILASLLPGSLGDGLRAQSEALRQTQRKVQKAAEMPESARRKAGSLQQQSSRLITATPAASAGGTFKAPLPAAESVSASLHPQTVHADLKAVKRVVPGVYTVETQPVEPGGSLSLTLQIEALKRCRPTGTYAYTLSSQQLPVTALDGGETPITAQGLLHFSHVDAWRYWQAPVANSLVIAILMFVLILVLRFIWHS